MSSWLGKILLIGYLLLPLAAAGNEDMWVVQENQARCLVEHRADYLEKGTDIIIIPIAECPETSLFSGAEFGLKNYSNVSRIPTADRNGEFDQIITYTPADLGCLTPSSIQFEGGKAFLPKAVECPE